MKRKLTMKKTILILVMLVFFAGCSGGNFKEQKFLGINGSPKSIKDTEYKAIEEVIEQDVNKVFYYEFNKHGFIQKSVYSNLYFGDTVWDTNTFKNGKCIEMKSYEKYKNNDLTTTKTLQSRTSKSEIWECIRSDSTMPTLLFIEFENLKKTIVEIEPIINYTLSKEEIIIDKNGNIVECKYINRKYYKKEYIEYWSKSTFNDKSQEVEKKMFAGYDNNTIYTYKYDAFDKKGNWTKKIEYQNGEIKSLTIREITYGDF